MSVNNSLKINGVIPFDLELKGTEGKEYMFFAVSVARDYKPEGSQYYPEDLLYCKAFGAKAKFISQYFGKGKAISIDAEIRKDEDYEKDGQTVKGQMYIHVLNAAFPVRDRSGAEETKPAAKTPAAPAKKGLPLGAPTGAKKAVPF